jgi:hypothetical protein
MKHDVPGIAASYITCYVSRGFTLYHSCLSAAFHIPHASPDADSAPWDVIMCLFAEQTFEVVLFECLLFSQSLILVCRLTPSHG